MLNPETIESGIPFGPLTRSTYESLGLSFYYPQHPELQEVAVKRGIQCGEVVKLIFSEMVEKAQDKELEELLRRRTVLLPDPHDARSSIAVYIPLDESAL